jgi:hypothetical protein
MGKTDSIKHNITLKDCKPFKLTYRRIAPAMYEEVRQHLNEMVECGSMTESQSLYYGDVVLVKTDNSLHFCIDFRQLNSF